MTTEFLDIFSQLLAPCLSFFSVLLALFFVFVIFRLIVKIIKEVK